MNNNEVESKTEVDILVVDDDKFYPTLLTRYLNRDTLYNYNMMVANTGHSGLSLCTGNDYDLLLVDHNLPDLTGPSFLCKLRQSSVQRPPPAIILTADEGQLAASEALRAEAADFLPKCHVNEESLARSIHNALAKDQLRRSVDMRTAELQAANEDLKKKNKQIQHFYQTVSHEVKTPLAAAREFVAIVKDGICGPVTDEQDKILDYAIASCDQIATHFNDLVEITRLDTGKVTLQCSECPVERLVQRAIASCSVALKAGDLILSTKMEQADLSVHVDENRMVQVISNLLGNAIKYTDPGGKIHITVSRSKNDLHFSISDTGCGISDQYCDEIFNRLFQASDRNHELLGAGLGLGLSIAQEIVLLHQGKIRVESKLGKGSCFSFNIPAANDEAPEPQVQRAA